MTADERARPRPRTLVLLGIAVVLVLTSVASVVAWRAADERAAVAEHRLSDVNVLLERADAAAHDTTARARFAAVRDGVVQARLAALAAGASTATPTVMSDGTHLGGIDVAQGIYETRDPGRSCAYGYLVVGYSNVEPLASADQPAVVTLDAGDVFRTSGCGAWHRVG